MNIFIKTQLIIFILMLSMWGYIRAGWTAYSPCSVYHSLEAAQASWENDACARITGRLVISSALECGSYKMNMLCSAESMGDLRSIRTAVNNLIKSDDHSFTFKLAAAESLHSIASADITGLSAEEILLMSNALTADWAENLIPSGDFKSSPCENDLIISNIIAAAVNTNCRHSFLSGANSQGRLFHSGHCAVHISREYETGHADYYRLYLYVKDHTGIADYVYHNTSSFLQSASNFLPCKQSINNFNTSDPRNTDNNSSFNSCYVKLRLCLNRLSFNIPAPEPENSLNITLLSGASKIMNPVLCKSPSLNTVRLNKWPFCSSYITISFFNRGTI